MDEKLFRLRSSCKRGSTSRPRHHANWIALTMAIWTKCFMTLALCFGSLLLRQFVPTQPDKIFAVRITLLTFGAVLFPSSLFQFLFRHSEGWTRWKKPDSRIVSCRAISSGAMSRIFISRPGGTRGIRGAGGESRPPDTMRRCTSGSPLRCGGSARLKLCNAILGEVYSLSAGPALSIVEQPKSSIRPLQIGPDVQVAAHPACRHSTCRARRAGYCRLCGIISFKTRRAEAS